MTGADLIAQERATHTSQRDWTPCHDDAHTDGALAKVAAALAVDGTDASVDDPCYEPDHWGLVAKHGYRGTHPDRIRSLVIAGALIAAEIDRVLRAERTP